MTLSDRSCLTEDQLKLFENSVKDTTINQTLIHELFCAYGAKGARGMTMQLEDIDFKISKEAENELINSDGTLKEAVNIEYLMHEGMSFFPASQFISMEPEMRLQVTLDSDSHPIVRRKVQSASIGLFISFILIYVTGSLPNFNEMLEGEVYIPQIIKNQFPGKNIKDELNDLWSCKQHLLDNSWIINFPLSELPESIQNRLQLSIAGLRPMAGFCACDLIADAPSKVVQLQESCKEYLELGLHWEIHPLFRPAEVIAQIGSPNKSFNALITNYATEESKSRLIKSKLLVEFAKSDKVDEKIFSFDPIMLAITKVDFSANLSDRLSELIDRISSKE
jgi:hypothetical protein